METFDCDPGEVPYGDENGDNACENLGEFYGVSDGVSVTATKGKGATTTYSGTTRRSRTATTWRRCRSA